MYDYRAPLRDMAFVVKELLGLSAVSRLSHHEGYAEATDELFDAIQEECARFSQEILSPLNTIGDRTPARIEAGRVVTAPGFKAGYEQFVNAGWNGLTAPVAYGGQGLPNLIGAPAEEMWHAANMAFTLCPLLTRGAIEAIHTVGTPQQCQRYLPQMVSGRWTGTMNLTEPQAGSDLAALRTRAVPENGHYRVTGQKIFITYGDQDYTENIIHLVLARLPDAPAGVKGLSLFIVPKFLVDPDGSVGRANDVRTVSLEHKLGIHASPTCMLSYGDEGGAWGELLGEPHRGLEIMFVMMNAARFSVGVQGLAIGQRAYQGALAYARERVQGTPLGMKTVAPIAWHPDVKRMLSSMKARLEACRALSYYAGQILDLALGEQDPQQRAWAQARSDLLTPIVKGFCSESGLWVANEALQVFGGMGYVEETGAAQCLRDARITTIYEGTTGIQANDLVGRKLLRDQGEMVRSLLTEIKAFLPELNHPALSDSLAKTLSHVLGLAEQSSVHLGKTAVSGNLSQCFGVAVPYLHLMGWLVSGWLMARSALVAARSLETNGQDKEFYQAKIATAVFYAEQGMVVSSSLHRIVVGGAPALDGMNPDYF